jgi:nitrate/nitrite transport system substrate-binding protein
MPSTPSQPFPAGASTPPAATPPLIDVRVGFVALSDCAPLLVARAQGFDRRHGLRLILSRANSWAAIRDRLVQGELDAAHCLYGLAYGVHLGIGGPQHPMSVLMGLSSNGQSISFSHRLQQAGITTAADLCRSIRAGERRYTFAHTFPTGTHAMWLHYWLACHGIDPLRDVRMLTVPPPQMVARLGDGSIDGCCVGEPWGAEAIAQGVGVTVATSQQIWPEHPEKVLASRTEFVEQHPATARALIMTLLEACRHLDIPANRRAAVPLLAAPDAVDSRAETLAPRFLGQYSDGLGKHWQDAHALRFFGDGQVTYPWLSDGMWFLTQFHRWGLLREAPDYAALARTVQQPSLYREAALALDIAAPASGLRSAVLCDGRRWTPEDPEGYVNGFAIRG